MKKLASGTGKVYCELSDQEFLGLARSTDVPDGSNVSLAWLVSLKRIADNNKQKLRAIASEANDLSASIGDLLDA